MAKVHKTAYSIRKGFEYQDLYCAVQILDAVERGAWTDRFRIESDEAAFVDDLEIIKDDGDVTGHQVKFHTTQEHEDSITTLTKQKTAKSRSLIQKLHSGWQRLTQNGERPAVIHFVSSNAAEARLRRAIDTADGRLNERFRSDGAYDKDRGVLARHLGVDADALWSFLSQVRWKFGYRSIAELKTELESSLRRALLPHDRSAIESVLGVVGWIATEYRDAFKAAEFLGWLHERSVFREAVEEKYPDAVPSIRGRERATTVRVGIVSMAALPAFSSSKVVGLEEPSPPSSWGGGLTDPRLAEVTGQIREALRDEYEEWLKIRLDAVLGCASTGGLDLLVFPRFSLSLDAAVWVGEWCAKNRCNAAIGGYCSPTTSREAALHSRLNLPDRNDESSFDPDEITILDPILRFDRKGRVSLSRAKSPYDKNERIVGDIARCQLETHTGWVQVVLLPSLSAVNGYADESAILPDELVICPSYSHRDLMLDKLERLKPTTKTPFVLSVSSHDAKTVGLAGVLPRSPSQSDYSVGDDWEGVTVIQIEYLRDSTNGWSAELRCTDRIPLVYGIESKGADQMPQRSGLPAALSTARQNLASKPPKPVAVAFSEEPARFYARRCHEAAGQLREKLGQAAADILPALVAVVKSLEDEGARLDPDARTRTAPGVPRPVRTPAGTRSSRFVGRADEYRHITRFIDPSNPNRILVLHGYSGIGKRTLLRNVQESDAVPSDWRWFRCVPDATMQEFSAQLLMRLDVAADGHATLGYDTFSAIAKGVAGCRVVVLEDGWNLPMAQDQAGHEDLLELLQVLCGAESGSGCKVILLAEWSGQLQFSRSHLLDPLRVEPLPMPDTEQLLQHLLSIQPLAHERPSARELEHCAAQTHGFPIFAELLANILREIPTAEVLETFHQRREVHRAILERLLRKSSLTNQELRFLHFASVFRIPVALGAFSESLGSNARHIISELSKRRLLLDRQGRVELHPLLRDHFRPDAERMGEIKRWHAAAARHLHAECSRRPRDLDVRIERVYHSLRGGVALDIADLHAFTSPLRSLILEGVRSRNWEQVHEAADRLLEVFERDGVAKIAKSLALDAVGDPSADSYFESVTDLDRSTLWLAIEFAKSKIRRRSFEEAERILCELEHKHANDGRVLVGWLRLFQARGEDEQALSVCDKILSSARLHWWSLFEAGLLLRRMQRLDLFVKAIESRDDHFLDRPQIRCLYALGCVVTGHDPDEGMKLLYDHWHSNRSSGHATADYGAALVSVGRYDDAANVLKDGLEKCRRDWRGLPSLRTEYARFLNHRERFSEAHGQFRELLRQRSPNLHAYREFATSLWDAARACRAAGNRAGEDSAIHEAEGVLRKLVTIAPGDKWASDMIHKVQHRVYASDTVDASRT